MEKVDNPTETGKSCKQALPAKGNPKSRKPEKLLGCHVARVTTRYHFSPTRLAKFINLITPRVEGWDSLACRVSGSIS